MASGINDLSARRRIETSFTNYLSQVVGRAWLANAFRILSCATFKMAVFQLFLLIFHPPGGGGDTLPDGIVKKCKASLMKPNERLFRISLQDPI